MLITLTLLAIALIIFIVIGFISLYKNKGSMSKDQLMKNNIDRMLNRYSKQGKKYY